MTHLKIQQNTTGIEEVSHSIIEKLYNLAISGDLDASSNLLGRLHTSATYRSYIDYLTTNYPNLYITSSDYYVNFADPEVRRIFALSNYGDGFGLLLSTALTITNLNNVTISGTGNLFKNNTTIEHFNELELFTSITTIPLECFNGCTNLTEITLPNTVTTIGGSAFNGCTNLKTANIPSENIMFGGYSFWLCGELEISVPSEITIDGFGVFGGCHKAIFPQLLTINYNNLSLRPNWAFSECYNLTKVKLGQNVQHIGNGMFNSCSNLTEILGLENVLYIGDQSFAGCTGLTGTLDLSSCVNFSLGFYSGLNSNGVGPFYGCTGITKIILGDWAHNAGSWNASDMYRPLFGNMPNLKTVDFKSLSSISNVQHNNFERTSWFVDCQNMENFIIRSTTIPPKVDQNNSLDIRYFGGNNVTIWVPDAAVSDYQTAWPEVASHIRGLSNLPSNV